MRKGSGLKYPEAYYRLLNDVSALLLCRSLYCAVPVLTDAPLVCVRRHALAL